MDRILIILAEIRPDVEFEKLDDLDGVLDSFDVLSLVNRLEEMFHIDIPIDMVTPENFNKVSSIADLVVSLGGHF